MGPPLRRIEFVPIWNETIPIQSGHRNIQFHQNHPNLRCGWLPRPIHRRRWILHGRCRRSIHGRSQTDLLQRVANAFDRFGNVCGRFWFQISIDRRCVSLEEWNSVSFFWPGVPIFGLRYLFAEIESKYVTLDALRRGIGVAMRSKRPTAQSSTLATAIGVADHQIGRAGSD